MVRHSFRWFLWLALTLLGGCSTLDYYQQLFDGQLALLQARRPITEVLADPASPPSLRQHLNLALQARAFASAQLDLPDNRSYRLYADLQRPYVVWNLFAAPEFSLQAQTSCFPIAGCVAYRGYYQLGRARGAAALLQAQGLETYVAGVEAYSTLGWLDDPLLSSMLQWDEQRLAALIFHELAHQRVYVGDDSAFNESFASFVEQQGLRQWLTARGQALADPAAWQRRTQFTALVLASRERLGRIYASAQPPAAMRLAKQAEFERLRREYRQLRDSQWDGRKAYDAWVNAPLNNAKLLPFGLYEQWLPAFATLFARSGQQWPAFYQQVERLAALPWDQRQQALQALQDSP